MPKKSSYKTNSWWSMRMVHSVAQPTFIGSKEDRQQDEILAELETKAKRRIKRKKHVQNKNSHR